MAAAGGRLFLQGLARYLKTRLAASAAASRAETLAEGLGVGLSARARAEVQGQGEWLKGQDGAALHG
eukprot:9484520-Pyramimonas_sp.AAC.1